MAPQNYDGWHMVKFLFLFLSFSAFSGTFDSLIVLKKRKEKKDYSVEFCNLTDNQKDFVLKNGAEKKECKKEELFKKKIEKKAVKK